MILSSIHNVDYTNMIQSCISCWSYSSNQTKWNEIFCNSVNCMVLFTLTSFNSARGTMFSTSKAGSIVCVGWMWCSPTSSGFSKSTIHLHSMELMHLATVLPVLYFYGLLFHLLFHITYVQGLVFQSSGPKCICPSVCLCCHAFTIFFLEDLVFIVWAVSANCPSWMVVLVYTLFDSDH